MNFLKSCPNCSSMLRFPATQGTILVQCPICSHRFQFSPTDEDPSSFRHEEVGHNLPFRPSLKSYLQLCADILYAPIDYIKSKRSSDSQKIQWVPVFLFTVLFLYIWSFSRSDLEKPTNVQSSSPSLETEKSPDGSEKPFNGETERLEESPDSNSERKSSPPSFEI